MFMVVFVFVCVFVLLHVLDVVGVVSISSTKNV